MFRTYLIEHRARPEGTPVAAGWNWHVPSPSYLSDPPWSARALTNCYRDLPGIFLSAFCIFQETCCVMPETCLNEDLAAKMPPVPYELPDGTQLQVGR